MAVALKFILQSVYPEYRRPGRINIFFIKILRNPGDLYEFRKKCCRREKKV